MSDWFDDYGWAEVADGLLTGAYPLDGDDVAVLAAEGVTRIVNLCEDCEYDPDARAAVEAAFATTGIEEARLELVDYGGILPGLLERAARRTAQWLDEGERVYLHCRAGWQRSATVAAAVVTLRDGVAPDVALASIRERKPSAEPLPHQLEDLWSWWRLRQARAARDPAS